MEVIPDIGVELEKVAILKNLDLQLEKAIEFLERKM